MNERPEKDQKGPIWNIHTTSDRSRHYNAHIQVGNNSCKVGRYSSSKRLAENPQTDYTNHYHSSNPEPRKHPQDR